MIPRRITLCAVMSSLLLPALAQADGAYTIEEQFQFLPDVGLAIVGPFLDENRVPWVLANNFNPDNPTSECVLIGPFSQDFPAEVIVGLDEADFILCTAIESGPDGGFLIRGYELVAPDELNSTVDCGDGTCTPLEGQFQPDFCPEDCGPRGFITLVDANFDIVGEPIWDVDHVQIGRYLQPNTPIAWSDSRDRVLVFFQSEIDLGVDSVPQLHGVSIAETTWQVRRVVNSWGDVSDGTLEGVDVSPEADEFLVVAHANGSEFLLYNGLESISAYPAGDVDWSDEKVDFVAFGPDESLYIQHHPRLDLTNLDNWLTRVSTDGVQTFYTRDVHRVIQVENPDTGEPVDITLGRPFLPVVTTTTVTFVRPAGNTFVFHVYDNFSGTELAIQPIDTIQDDTVPTHVADARRPDRIIFMTANMEGRRFVNTILWDPTLETPGGIPSGPDGGGGDGGIGDGGGGGDAGNGDGGGGGGGGGGAGDEGCCQTAHGPRAADLALGALVVLWLTGRRRGRRLAPRS